MKFLISCLIIINYYCYGFNQTSLEANTEDEDLWGSILEEWTLSGNFREKRVMIDRIDKESKVIPGKILNSNNNNNNHNSNNNNNQPSVTETDLYLLNAIEKLVYKVDIIEKRLRRVEQMLYYTMAGNRIDQEPCPDNFTRIANNCYTFITNQVNWKVASRQCKKLNCNLIEMETIDENQELINYLQNNQYLRGLDFWTGGLNPGLLWIWSNSGRPVINNDNNNKNQTILGDGRCLRLAYNSLKYSYGYYGTDCSKHYSFICELPENTTSNQLYRLGKSRRIFDEL